MKHHNLWQLLGRDLPIRVKFLVINFLVMATTLIVSAILILRASSAVRENVLAAEKALITQSANTLSATVDEVSTISETIVSFPFLKLVVSIPKADITSAEQEVLMRQFWIYLIITALALAIEFILSTSLTTRLTNLSSKMTVHREDEAPLEKLPDTDDRDEIGQLTGTYNQMIDQIETLMEEQAATADQLRVTEVRALQAQINPHFLYNMLDMINWMARSGSGEGVSEAVQNLLKFYKLTLSKKEIYVTIEEELRHIDLYVLLQNMRFDDKIDFIIDVPDELMEYSIPKLVLQPVIENALLHGILEKVTREGTVVVMAWEEMNEISGQEDIVFTISDDGVGMSSEKLKELNDSLQEAELRKKSSSAGEEAGNREAAITNGSGIAITNTHLRLVLLYGHGYGLTFRSEEGKGTEVEVRIPKRI